LQEVWIKAWNHRNTFTGGSKISTWLCTIAKNHFLNHVKKQNPLKHSISFETWHSDQQVEHVDPCDILARKENIILLRKLISKLSTEHKIVVELKLKGLSGKQIAERVRCDEGTARTRLCYALKILRGMLEIESFQK
jgi:RNA polymerase sigma-70 factor (ECF subfamily)